MPDFVIYIGAALVASSVVVLVWALSSERSLDTVQANLARGGRAGDSRQIALSASAKDRLLDPAFAAIAGGMRSFTGSAAAERAQRKLELAGLYNTGWTVERLLVIRFLSLGVGIALAVLLLSGGVDRNSVLLAILVGAVAYVGPNAWLDRRVSDRKKLVERQLPDVIDQMTVAVEAGLGFDAAMARAAEARSGPLAEELQRAIQDIQVGMPRDEALEGVVERTDVADLRQFVVAIRQSAKHGLPIGRVLRVQAQELREKRRSRIEERAAKLPVKIVFPLVFCILPSLFVVILGPAGLEIMENF